MPQAKGRKPEYNDPKKLAVAVNQYFADCESRDVFPDEPGMRLYLRIRKEDVDRMLDPKNKHYEQYKEIFDTAMDRRSSWLERTMVSQPKLAQGCMNALKQPANGGYTDRPKDTGTKKITLNVIGIGGEEACK